MIRVSKQVSKFIRLTIFNFHRLETTSDGTVIKSPTKRKDDSRKFWPKMIFSDANQYNYFDIDTNDFSRGATIGISKSPSKKEINYEILLGSLVVDGWLEDGTAIRERFI